MKSCAWILLSLPLLAGCINTETPAVDEEEEASWWCSFYGTCPEEKDAISSFYGSSNKSGSTADTAYNP